jgi:hypothetical protein
MKSPAEGQLSSTSVTFTWYAGSGLDGVYWYNIYVGSSAPVPACNVGQCRQADGGCEGAPHDIYVGNTGDHLAGDPRTQEVTVPATGAAVYVRLFTNYYDGSSYTCYWRDYQYTAAIP